MVHLLKQQWKNYVIVALLSALVSTWVPAYASFAPTIVKTIQCGDIAINNGFTFGNSTLSTPVTIAKSFVIYNGTRGLNAGSQPNTIDLASTTLVHAERQGTTNDLATNYCVVEFY